MLQRFMGLFSGPRPDVTHAQGGGLIVAGIPILANLLHAFGVYSTTPEQQDALSQAVTWGSIIGGVLIGGDAVIRTGRNTADAKIVVGATVVQQRATTDPKAADPNAPTRSVAKPTAEATTPPTAAEIEAAMQAMPEDERASLTPFDPEVDDQLGAQARTDDVAEAEAPPPEDE